MRIAPFWRTSLNDSKTGSQQYYFDHFEIHPIKVRLYVLSSLPSLDIQLKADYNLIYLFL